MDHLAKRHEAAPKAAGRQAVHRLSLDGPGLQVATQVPVPGAHAPGEQGQAIAFFARAQRGLGLLAREELFLGD